MRFVHFKIFSFFIFLFFGFKSYCQPQGCVLDALLNEFPNQTAVLGEDSVFITNTEPTEITLASGGSNFQLFINGILDQNASGFADAGDVIKIKPHTIGTEPLNIQGDCMNVNYFSPYVVISTPLPVVWLTNPSLKFINNNQTHITWSVATQSNNEKYIIEHSNPESFRDGSNFLPIGEIAGDGTSNETKHYEYIHTSPSIGINYYRIKQVDYDGQYSYSDIASMRYDGDNNITIYPNPTTSEVSITTSEPTTLQILDVYGRLLTKQAISEGQNTINLSELPKGIFIFAVADQRYLVRRI